MPVHSAPSRPFATCSAQDQSSGSDFTSQYAMASMLLSLGGRMAACRSPTVADLGVFVDPDRPSRRPGAPCPCLASEVSGEARRIALMTTDVYPGKDLGTLEVTVTDDMVRHYIGGLAEPNPWYTAA